MGRYLSPATLRAAYSRVDADAAHHRELVEAVRAHIEDVGLGPAEVKLRVVDQRTLVLDRRGVVHAVVGRWTQSDGSQAVMARDLRGHAWYGVRDPLAKNEEP